MPGLGTRISIGLGYILRAFVRALWSYIVFVVGSLLVLDLDDGGWKRGKEEKRKRGKDEAMGRNGYCSASLLHESFRAPPYGVLVLVLIW